MLAGYTAVEATLKQIFAVTSEPLPIGHDNHKNLLLNASEAVQDVRPSIFPIGVFDDLDELRSFRNVAMHAYDRFRLTAAQDAYMAAKKIASVLEECVLNFIHEYDPQGNAETEPGDERPPSGAERDRRER